MANIDPLGWLSVIALLLVLLAVGGGLVFRVLQRLTLSNALLERRVVALQEQTQRELLAVGQHVLAADKLLNRLGERLDNLENARPGETQYGQLEAVLSKGASAGSGAEISVAEAKLRSLLQHRAK